MGEIRKHLCESCGGVLTVDVAKQIYTCQFCGLAFDYAYFKEDDVLEKARRYEEHGEFTAALEAYNFYLTLLQYKNAGWFRYCNGVLVGRPAFPKVENKNLDYIKAADKALGNIPHIMEMDIGHTFPNFTLINGAMCKVKYADGKGEISFKLK